MAKTPVGYRSPFPKKSSPVKIAPWLISAGISALPGIISGIGSMMGGKKRRAEQKAAQLELDKAKKEYMSTEFKNPYADLKNPYQENVYEDLKVDTQGADYLKQQQQQSQANIMQGLKGVAGGSGVAGLAQSMSNISSQQAQRASASISQQEAKNQQLRARGDQQRQTGQHKVDSTKMQGEHWKRKQELQRKENIYGLGLDRADAANKARQTAKSGMAKGFGQAASSFAGSALGSVDFGGGGGGGTPMPIPPPTVDWESSGMGYGSGINETGIQSGDPMDEFEGY